MTAEVMAFYLEPLDSLQKPSEHVGLAQYTCHVSLTRGLLSV